MAKDRKKYPMPEIPTDTKSVGSEILGSNIPKDKAPKLYKDGTLEVQNIEERDTSLSYDLDEKEKTYFFAKNLDPHTEVQYIPQFVDKVFKTNVSFKGEVKEAFAVFRNDIKKLVTKDLDRYRVLPKPFKKEIDLIEQNQNTFIFTETRGDDSFWNRVYKESTELGPFNYDVELQVTKDIKFINDLIVIRSGKFENKYDQGNNGYANLKSGWGIAWVSPHDTLAYSGNNLYFSTGTSYFDKLIETGSPLEFESGASMLGKNYGVTNSNPSGGATYYTHALSSKFVSIKAGQKLGTGMSYAKHSANSTTSSDALDANPLYDDFYYTYIEYKDKFNKSGWNGVIPSGYWFTIETWSTNPKYVGFDGEITVKPTGRNDPTCTYTAETVGTSYDTDYQVGVRKAYGIAKRRFYKKLNKILISKGIKPKPARLKKYDTLLERAAQGVYDGLTIVRNEQVAKVQGLEVNPINNPMYYDGTSRIYGGNKWNANYNPALLFRDRWIDGEQVSTDSSSASSSTSSSSNQGGGSSY